MTYAYLGFLDILQNVFTKLVENFIAPLLSDILLSIIQMIGSFLQKVLGELLLVLFCMLLRVVDYITVLFDIVAGITPVQFNNQEMSLVEALINLDGIGRVFWLFTAIAMVLTFVFTFFAVLRSMADSVFENKRPVSKAIVSGLKASFTFFMIPMLCLVLLQFSNIVLQTVDQIDYTSMSADQEEIIITGTTTGDVIFTAMVMDAIKYPQDIANNAAAKAEHKSRLRAAYLTRQPGPTSEIYVYENTDQVFVDFDYLEINYVVSILVTLAMLIMILLTSITMIKRCFDILVLYLVSPFFASTMVYDDGKMFKEWQEAFVARFFAGLGSLISMKIYLIIIPFIVSDRFVFVNNSFVNSLLTTLFALGGMWATYKSNALITQILDPDVAGEEAERSAMMRGYMMKALTGK